MTDERDEDALRLLTLNDERFLSSLMGMGGSDEAACGVDEKTAALARLAALIAVEGSTSSYTWAATNAVNAGATPGEIVGVLLAVAPVIGAARVVTAAPRLALAIGYDVDLALETLEGT